MKFLVASELSKSTNSMSCVHSSMAGGISLLPRHRPTRLNGVGMSKTQVAINRRRTVRLLLSQLLHCAASTRCTGAPEPRHVEARIRAGCSSSARSSC